MIWGILVLITGLVLSPLAWILRQHQNNKRPVIFLGLFGSLGIPTIAFGFYVFGGSPSMESFPYTWKVKDGISLNEVILGAEKRLAENPMDEKGWDVMAPIYFRLKRMEDACQAYEKAVFLLGETAQRLADYGEACAFAEEKDMSPKVRDLFERAIHLDPKSLKAHFYLAQAAQLDGNQEKVLAHLKAMVDSAPPDAPWTQFMRQMLAKMDER